MPKKIKFRNVVTGTVIEVGTGLVDYYRANPSFKEIKEEEK
ncbi:hypothetical protein [Crassaminicella thermophila]|nr:hypothetical protein [Crassaminicella thermophila]